LHEATAKEEPLIQENMKSDIHPRYNSKTKVKCACGATFVLGSTKEDYSVDICSQCHPFYTGKQKLIDTAGRVDKFRERQKIAEQRQTEMKQHHQSKSETLEEKITRKAKANTEAKVAVKEEKTKKAPEKKVVAAKKPVAKKPVAKKTAKKK